MIFPIAIVIITQWFGIQGFVPIVFEDIVFPVYNKEYFTEPEGYITNENTLALNFTIIKLLPIEAQIHSVLKAASMGEYVVDTGIDIVMDLCDIIAEPILAAGMFQELGFSPDHCPPEIGTYGTEGYIFPTDGLPDDIPPNQYMMTTSILYEDQSLLVWQSFLKV
ncbi:uncharacterized protein LOC130674413 isoform X3 [Microplitis mediator]|uniref:uncharacterized protein LOC130674413 isoform X3 n=1 Tax=Microplitis mediator TaxID=375433 RepID=UPI0025545696|nr:uncharacterized protein LOC130674413 isoform X3 [Microplitis mediator]